MRTNIKTVGTLVVSMMFLAFLVVPGAKADTINLTVPNGTTGEPAGFVYGTATLTLNNDGTITFDLSSANGWGFHNADFGFNYDGTGTLSASNISYSYAGGDPGTPTFTTSGYGEMDGFGKFTSGFNGGTGSSSDYTSLDFTISTTGGFTSLSQLENGNSTSSDNWFASQMANLSTGCTGFVGNTGSTGSTTGFTGSGCSGTSVPEPGTLALMGVGLLGLAILSRRRLLA